MRHKIVGQGDPLFSQVQGELGVPCRKQIVPSVYAREIILWRFLGFAFFFFKEANQLPHLQGELCAF